MGRTHDENGSGFPPQVTTINYLEKKSSKAEENMGTIKG